MSRIRPSKGLDDFIPSGSLLTGGADTYPAPPETPASRDKLIQPFFPKKPECVPWFASFCATQNDFSGQWVACEIGLWSYSEY
jgi:hypothetical protein